ncbi:histidine kinase/DNA gyrase B/HSP90-like ATPase [Dyadobacter jejuensis]|uniref:Histidine kinase/DNA gyrase B/HSP90-like ATPase n=1 Tax=Dyadobacter jejuensis TaxID=1082580 RepID=A0A316AI41_9BACT|nr:ATP-binding protein [Dyadobacter jejuensis]PWJ57382.1 histidine kinase/DNA gyrase B/HSP90-like ATPase [Dyadobacter jejuensis]
MIDYTNILSTSAEPEASSMIETFRAIGYSIETAIADIIDNSITAGARNIWLDYDWMGSKTTLSILDDGIGMNNKQLIQAMRPGSKSPLNERKQDDLGRFGLGLKTASFSQTRKFTVFSKSKGGELVFWTWDLDYVKQEEAWKLIQYIPEHEVWSQKTKTVDSGTCVIWWDLDRLTKGTTADDEKAKSKFLGIMDSVKSHISMVFHRYMDEGIKILFRGREIKSWDPFMIGIDGLQTKPETRLAGGSIRIKGFILPHRSKLSVEEYDYGKGPKDNWTAHQGFYVYRNRRLLVGGDWLGLFKREVHYDLCRIQIDLPNNLDNDWQIDIKKSIARPPSIYRDSILSLAKEVRNQAVEVYRHKGKVLKRKLASDEYFLFWEERARHGKRFYKINRNHPLITELYSISGNLKYEIEKVIQFIEETVPVPLITLQESENEKPHGQPFEGVDPIAIKETMQRLFSGFVSSGLSIEKAKARILNTEPFNFYPEYIEFMAHE